MSFRPSWATNAMRQDLVDLAMHPRNKPRQRRSTATPQLGTLSFRALRRSNNSSSVTRKPFSDKPETNSFRALSSGVSTGSSKYPSSNLKSCLGNPFRWQAKGCGRWHPPLQRWIGCKMMGVCVEMKLLKKVRMMGIHSHQWHRRSLGHSSAILSLRCGDWKVGPK